MLAERSLPGSMIVDATGHRFFNESCDYMTAGQIMLGHDDGEPAHMPMWLIFDQRYRNSYVFAAGVMPHMEIPREFYDAGIVHRPTPGGTVEQDRNPGTGCRCGPVQRPGQPGHDDDFDRGLSHYDRYYGDPTHTPNPNLRPIERPPFYAVKVVPGDLGTCGGVSADEYGRALRKDGKAIEGLYAVGNVAGNAFGRFYPGPGATIGQGVTFAYIAANHAADRLQA